MTKLIGRRAKIIGTSNKFAEKDIGKSGVITGTAPLGMVIVTLDDGREFWANTYNLAVGA